MAKAKHIERLVALTIAVGTAAAATVATPAVAQAELAPVWAAVAYSPVNGKDFPTGDAPTKEMATNVAVGGCVNNGGKECRVVAWSINGCVSLYVDPKDTTRFSGGIGPDSGAASGDAWSRVPDGVHRTTWCSSPREGAVYGGGEFKTQQESTKAPEPQEPCFPDPFDLNFPGAC